MNQIPILDLAASAAAVLLFLFAARSFVMGIEPRTFGLGLRIRFRIDPGVPGA